MENNSNEENEGLKQQLHLLITKVNRIREALAVETDPSREVQFEFQIKKTEAQIDELRQSIAATTNPLKPGTLKPITSDSKTIRIVWICDPSADQYSKELRIFFKNLERKGDVYIFDIQMDTQGDKEAHIKSEIQHADYVLCLLTPIFLVTMLEWVEYAYNTYKKPIVPVLLEELPLEDTLFERLVTLPRNPRTVSQWPSANAAYMNILQEVKNLLKSKG